MKYYEFIPIGDNGAGIAFAPFCIVFRDRWGDSMVLDLCNEFLPALDIVKEMLEEMMQNAD